MRIFRPSLSLAGRILMVDREDVKKMRVKKGLSIEAASRARAPSLIQSRTNRESNPNELLRTKQSVARAAVSHCHNSHTRIEMKSSIEQALSTFSLTGVAWAAVSGAAMGAGYGLLIDAPTDKVVKRYFLGGACFVTGMYMFSPAWLREFWMMTMQK